MSHLKYADAKYVFLTDFDGTITLLVSVLPMTTFRKLGCFRLADIPLVIGHPAHNLYLHLTGLERPHGRYGRYGLHRAP